MELTTKKNKYKRKKARQQPAAEQEMSFLEHVEALRWHIIRALFVMVLLAIGAFVMSKFIFNHIILAPKMPGFITNRLLCELGNLTGISYLCINSNPFQIISIKMAGQFSADLKVSLVSGLIIAFPYAFWEFWRFIKPAFHEEEENYARGAVFYSSLLFMLGVLFGYFVILPLSVHFLGSYNVSSEVTNQINLGSYISTVTSVTLASGVIFELPILIFFLSKAGLVNPAFLRKYRRHSLVIILVLSAIITPPDVFSQLLVSGPLIVLYEIGIIISKRIVKKDESLLV